MSWHVEGPIAQPSEEVLAGWGSNHPAYSWHRIVDDDDSTIAYVPDEESARDIIRRNVLDLEMTLKITALALSLRKLGKRGVRAAAWDLYEITGEKVGWMDQPEVPEKPHWPETTP